MLLKCRLLLLMLALILTACANVKPNDILNPENLPEQVLIPYSFRNKAFDGNSLWSIIKEDNASVLIQQNLVGKMLTKVPISEKLPTHRSLSWAHDQVWLLDQEKRIYSISTTGQTLTKLQLQDLAEDQITEQIIWTDQELWVLTSAYLSDDGSLIPSRLYQIDPKTGKNLNVLKLQADEELQKAPRNHFDNVAHQNLSADAQAFYVARANIFEKGQNGIYRIDRSTGQISYRPLERIYTGLNSLFWWKDQLLGIELIDTHNCADFCRGKLAKL